MAQTKDQAEALALGALAWLLGPGDLAAAFLAETGAAPGSLAENAADPAFLGAVLDFLLAEESRLLAFAAATAQRPEEVWQARHHLPGGPAPHWT